MTTGVGAGEHELGSVFEARSLSIVARVSTAMVISLHNVPGRDGGDSPRSLAIWHGLVRPASGRAIVGAGALGGAFERPLVARPAPPTAPWRSRSRGRRPRTTP
jgi:hypothetical protein